MGSAVRIADHPRKRSTRETAANPEIGIPGICRMFHDMEFAGSS